MALSISAASGDLSLSLTHKELRKRETTWSKHNIWISNRSASFFMAGLISFEETRPRQLPLFSLLDVPCYDFLPASLSPPFSLCDQERVSVFVRKVSSDKGRDTGRVDIKQRSQTSDHTVWVIDNRCAGSPLIDARRTRTDVQLWQQDYLSGASDSGGRGWLRLLAFSV